MCMHIVFKIVILHTVFSQLASQHCTYLLSVHFQSLSSRMIAFRVLLVFGIEMACSTSSYYSKVLCTGQPEAEVLELV